MKKFQVNKKGAGKVDQLYPGPLGKIVIYSDDSLQLYDITARKVLHEVPVNEVKAVYWNQNFTYAAIVTRNRMLRLWLILNYRAHDCEQEHGNLESKEGNIKDQDWLL